MKWTKTISQLNRDVIRVACVPREQRGVEATFAVKYPSRFRKCRTVRRGRSETARIGNVTISIEQDGKRLSSRNLCVSWTSGKEAHFWRPGKVDDQNLGGAFFGLDLWNEHFCPKARLPYDPMRGFNSYVYHIYSLLPELKRLLQGKVERDRLSEEAIYELVRYSRGERPVHFKQWPAEVRETADRITGFPPGYLSRSGLTVLFDDSCPWDVKTNWIRPTSRRDSQVLYIVFYGQDYKKGLNLFRQLLGAIPVVPEWVMGIWFSCFRKMGEAAFQRLKRDFDRHRLPLDVVVVDTDWHRLRWHGFDWNRRLFPDPDRFARWLRENGLHAAFNVHPQYIPRKDSRLPEFLKRTKALKVYLDLQHAPHPIHVGTLSVDLFDKKQVEAYFDVFHRPIEKQGCDLWWVDGTLQDQAGRDSTVWMNELYSRYGSPASGKRSGFTLSRGQGLGAHRSTLLFTGDTLSQWKILEKEVVVTARAANSLMAYVSHDIGGFFPGSEAWKVNKPPDELYVRWIQFGCFSPILRLHSDHGIREPWRFSERVLTISRRFFQLRRALSPYLMSLVREAHDKGVGLCRPMYYEFPEADEAYRHELQYMLGDAILVSPVVRADRWVTTWFPEGNWYHVFLERSVEGPSVVREKVPVEFIPIYVREGHSVPFTWNTLARASAKKRTDIYLPGDVPLAQSIGIDL